MTQEPLPEYPAHRELKEDLEAMKLRGQPRDTLGFNARALEPLVNEFSAIQSQLSVALKRCGELEGVLERIAQQQDHELIRELVDQLYATDTHMVSNAYCLAPYGFKATIINADELSAENNLLFQKANQRLMEA